MPSHFRISFRFLDRAFHGRGDAGEPEWPPSPLRVFQALSNAAARLSGDGVGGSSAAALRWLESSPRHPIIIAAKTTETTSYQLYVPDNVGDLVAQKWSKGEYVDTNNHPIDISSYRTEKLVRPLLLAGDSAVHYLWPLPASRDFEIHRETLISIARSVSHLGWGIDLVVTDAAMDTTPEDLCLPTAERWIPGGNSGGALLRVPVAGTLEALERRHAAFLKRIQRRDNEGEVLLPVPPLPSASFGVVTYRRETDLTRPPYAVFALRVLDDSRFATFEPQWRRLHLVGMLRHAASEPDFAAAIGWEKRAVDAFVLGHDKSDRGVSKPTADVSRLIFIPLPSMEWRGETRGDTTGSIRRVLVTVNGHIEPVDFKRIVRALEGRELIDEKTKRPVAFLRRQTDNDKAIKGYFAESSTWATVTPVVLPGHDDPRKLRGRLRETTEPLSAVEKANIVRKLDARIDALLRKTLRQAGFSETVSRTAVIEWRGTGYLPGTALASHYGSADQHRRFRKLHVRIRFLDGNLLPFPIAGPICIGGGRFSGLGLFAPDTD